MTSPWRLRPAQSEAARVARRGVGPAVQPAAGRRHVLALRHQPRLGPGGRRRVGARRGRAFPAAGPGWWRRAGGQRRGGGPQHAQGQMEQLRPHGPGAGGQGGEGAGRVPCVEDRGQEGGSVTRGSMSRGCSLQGTGGTGGWAPRAQLQRVGSCRRESLRDVNSPFPLSVTGHAKDALSLAQMQEQTLQLEQQAKLKVHRAMWHS